MRRHGSGTKEGAPSEMRRRGLPGRRPGNPGLGRCGARARASQARSRATAGLRPWLLKGLCQELADRGVRSLVGSPPAEARPAVGVRTPQNEPGRRKLSGWCAERRGGLRKRIAHLKEGCVARRTIPSLIAEREDRLKANPAPPTIRAMIHALLLCRPRDAGTHSHSPRDMAPLARAARKQDPPK